ncbi:enoyl-CoA delta isomerase 1, peroxisomal-like [Vitis riparia]|uniref:enoyl-CoA delta isomerase 1, peroxisomal-like n=1 Tax=Vitis riparia TaxID=96939 RepID=UPI00155ACB0F|nr:enoyl-CoA delta isomerase 1, peroxisomal-like [Vitis riparia]
MCSLEKRGNIFILTLTGPGEHRLNPTLLDAISAALSRVRAESSMSSALITTAEGKFFSNGYDLAWASASGGVFLDRLKLMSSKLRSLVADLISLPMPTIAAISGHCSAAAAILALSHDYVLMRNDRGFIYMSELDIELKIPDWFVALIRSKIGAPRSQRELMLRAAKLTAHDALNWGIIDSAHDSTEETVKAAIRLGEVLVGRKWDGHVYAQIRMRMLADVFDKIGCDESVGEVCHTRSRL